MRISVVGISLLVASAPMSCGARSGIEGPGGGADAGLPAAEGSGGSPYHADMTFYVLPSTTLSLTRVDGPEGCDAVGGQGWFLDPDVSRVGAGYETTTFEVCPEACTQIPETPDDWGLSVATCG